MSAFIGWQRSGSLWVRRDDSAVLPVGVAGSWSLSFRDEFDGPAIDPNKWVRAGDAGGGGYSADDGHTFDFGNWVGDPANLTFGSSTLILSVTAASPTVHGAGIATKNKGVTLGYGFYETRARCPGAGGWPASWLFSTSGIVEVDMMEGSAWVSQPSNIIHAQHWSYSPDLSETHGAIADGSGWHVYGCNWQPGTPALFYVDGVLTWTSTHVFAPSGQYWILNNASYPVGTTDTGTLECDYVRYWTGS